MAVTGTQVHQLTVTSGMNLLGGTRDAGVEAMVEPDLHEPSACLLALDQALDLRTRHTCRLLHEHVRAGPQRALGECRELIVNGGDHDHVGRARKQLVEARAGLRAVFVERASRPRGSLTS